MAKVLKVAAIVLGVVAVVATAGAALGVIMGGTMMLTGIASAATIAAIAGVGSALASMGAQLLARPPPAVGSVAQSLFESNAPQPYLMGEGYAGGVERYRTGYGGTVDSVVNPYLGVVFDYSGGGPHESITPYVDFAAVGSYYSGFLYTDTQLGACPESSALTPNFSGMPSWDSSYKLSGKAAILWNSLFDKAGKVFASGLPVLGAYGQWAKVYDPRLDSTFPGGSGSHRLGDETTYEWSENPALHYGTYAFGRYQGSGGDKLTMGVGLPAEGIDWVTIAAWANTCVLNNWTIFGRIFEPGDRWANLKDIATAGGAVPAFSGAVLSVHFSAPVVALDTITEADIADEALTVTFMQSYRDRLNTIVPKYTSAANNWEQVSAAPVVVSTYLSDDGEERSEEWAYNLVKNVDQATQLARYQIEDSRELHPIQLVCHPRMRGYRPGDCLHLTLPQIGLDHDAIILTRSIDPATGKVTFTFQSETPGKHAYALGMTGTPPEAPGLTQTGEGADSVTGSLRGVHLLVNRSVNYPLSSDDTSITIAAFTANLDNGLPVSFPSDTITGLTSGGDFGVFYDLAAGTYSAVVWPAATQMADPAYAYIGRQATSTSGTFSSPDSPPPGYCVADDTPILLADGTTALASTLAIDTVVRTKHEKTLAWGDYPIAAIDFETAPVFACPLTDLDGHPVTIRATANHRFLIANRWVFAKDIGTPDGTASVAKITVAEAHTYVSANVLSHNLKPLGGI